MRVRLVAIATLLTLSATGVALARSGALRTAPDQHDHGGDAVADAGHASALPQQAGGIPASGDEAAARLAASPRKGEWQFIKIGASDSVAAWVVRPQSTALAPLVIVIHENTGLTTWNRAVADQLAADGFVAIVPDLITMKRTGGDLKSDWPRQEGTAAIGSLSNEDAQRFIDGVAKWGMALPNVVQKYGIVGFCWGGARSFLHAVHAPNLGASVVYYGAAPTAEQMNAIRAPVLGLYGGNDARITAAVPGVDSTMKRLNKTYAFHVFPGAAHGFLRAQEAAGGPNADGSKAAWPLMVAWFKRHLAPGE